MLMFFMWTQMWEESRQEASPVHHGLNLLPVCGHAEHGYLHLQSQLYNYRCQCYCQLHQVLRGRCFLSIPRLC